ncbi:MAG: hypothetical protein IKP51_00110 [Treponema sp.]|nr:hypothetical protein [Treponema sp.]
MAETPQLRVQGIKVAVAPPRKGRFCHIFLPFHPKLIPCIAFHKKTEWILVLVPYTYTFVTGIQKMTLLRRFFCFFPPRVWQTVQEAVKSQNLPAVPVHLCSGSFFGEFTGYFLAVQTFA